MNGLKRRALLLFAGLPMLGSPPALAHSDPASLEYADSDILTTSEPSPETSSAASASCSANCIAKKIKFSTLWFLHYANGQSGGEDYNRFYISRGYLTLKFKPTSWFEPRITMDTHQDDAGSWMVRLKYLYGKLKPRIDSTIITDPYLEFGLVHNPWFDYEEHINYYRMQGTMFIERNGLMNSADLGATAGALLGPKLDKEYRDTVNSKYPGTFGSFAIGVYNGAGYHGVEANENKSVEGRLSVRPLGPLLPNLQVTYFGVLGKGNSDTTPDWQNNDIFASFEHEYFVLTAQYAFGSGNQKASEVDDAGDALPFSGYSAFAELKLPWINSSLMGRYDWWDWDPGNGDDSSTRVVGGFAYHFNKMRHDTLLLDIDYNTYESGQDPDWAAKLTMQVHY